MQFTKDQTIAIDKFKYFLKSNEKEFYLFGAAGCGKSFLLKHLVTTVLKEHEEKTEKKFSVFLTAPTNKAVEVLEGMAGDIDASLGTIYSLFGFRVGNNYSNGESHLVYPSKANYLDAALIVIDECSMLPNELINYIKEHTFNSKIVYVGDNYQLAPVNGKAYWTNTPAMFTAILREPVRNKGSRALINLCTQLRDTVDTLVFKEINEVPGSIDFLNDDQAKEWISKADFNSSRILCYTNNKAIKYIKYIEDLNQQKHFIRDNQVYVNNDSMVLTRGVHSVRFYPDELVRIIEGSNKSFIKWINNKSHYLSVSEVSIESVRQPSKRVTALVARDPKELKEKLRLTASQKRWRDYFTIKETIMDLRLPYACTIHKSQGSTYDEVLIDLGSFRVCDDPEVAARLLYVAVSRARKRIYFYGKLPKKYGALICQSHD